LIIDIVLWSQVEFYLKLRFLTDTKLFFDQPFNLLYESYLGLHKS
jgi:hypothetical protein